MHAKLKLLQSSYLRRNAHNVAVLGAGQMGTGIAKVLISKAKTPVILIDINSELTKKAEQIIQKQLDTDVVKLRMTTSEAEAAKKLLTITDTLSETVRCDIIIEAVTEKPSLKFQIFKELDTICKPTTILASNTSSISITQIASHTNRPSKVIGMHFMNPVPVMKLVEIIPGLATSAETIYIVKDLAKRMDKVTTESRDIAGFIANRLLAPYLNEAIQALYEGLGTKEDIDTTMKLGCNMPMGPLTLADFIGLDTLLSILQVIHAEKGDKYKPCPLLSRYVEAGWLGKKSGRGFFVYSE